MPVLPRILRVGNVKLVVGFGLLCFAASCFIDIHLTAQSSGRDFVASQLLRGVGQIFSFMPLNQISVGAVSRAETADAAGLFNMARNLGGSIGLALLGVFIDRRTEIHADAIRESVNANSVLLQDHLAQQGAYFAAQSGDAGQGLQMAIGSLAVQIHQQAMVMTFSDCFWVLGVGLLVMMPLLLMLRSPKPTRQPVMETH
jgi:DHA2 family multidrug resistance protein